MNNKPSNLRKSNINNIDNSKRVSSAAAGRISDRGEPNRVAPISSRFQVANFGFDTVVLCFSASIPAELLRDLAEHKKKCQASNDLETPFNFGQTDIFSFNLSRVGSKLYPYVLSCGDVRLCLSSRGIESSIPSMSVSIGSLSCQSDVFDTLRRFKLWFKHHGIVWKNEKVSRLDICSDICCSIKDLNIIDSSRYITRAEKHAVQFSAREVTGVQIGRGDIVLRIYDKIKEMIDKGSEAKQQFFGQKWAYSPYVDVTRVEFQLRRKAIKEFFPRKSDFKTVAKFHERLWNYLVDWFRLTENPVDRENKHQQRAVNHPFWDAVVSAVEIGLMIFRKKRKSLVSDIALKKQAYGCIMSVVAAMGIDKENVEQIYDSALDYVLKGFRYYVEDAIESGLYDVKQRKGMVTF